MTDPWLDPKLTEPATEEAKRLQRFLQIDVVDAKKIYQSIMSTTIDAAAAERERCAAMLKELSGQSPLSDNSWARVALAIGARAIQRGRLLTDQEKLENLAKAFEEEGDHEIAAAIRKGE